MLLVVGLLISAVSFWVGTLVVMAAANHPTGNLDVGFGACVVGFFAGIVMAAVGGVIAIIG